MNEVRCPLREAADISPKQPALLREGLTLSYSEYDQVVQAAMAKLEKVGISEGDRVGIFLQTDWYYPVLFMALLRLGAVACPLSTRVPKEQLKQALEAIRCRTLISVVREGKAHKKMWGVDIYDPEALLTFDAEPEGILSPHLQLDRPATILFTSGTKGVGKAVLHSFGNHYYSASASNANIHVRSGHRWLLNLPLYHISGISILFRTILGGATVVLPSYEESLEDSLLLHQITHLSLVPTQLYRLLKMEVPRDAIDRLEALLIGGGPCPQHLIREATDKGYPVYATYGLTEMASQVCTTSPSAALSQRQTSGVPLRFHEIRIGSDDEILVRGKSLFMGYVEEERIRRPVDAEGWFHTGDLGHLRSDGNLVVTGRKDNMFISGGENIHPELIESVLCELEFAEEAVVVPVNHEEYGLRPVAFLKTASTPPDEELIQAELRQKLPGFMVPIHFYPWPEVESAGIKTSRMGFQRHAEELSRKG